MKVLIYQGNLGLQQVELGKWICSNDLGLGFEGILESANFFFATYNDTLSEKEKL